MNEFCIAASAAFGLESVVAGEMARLGYRDTLTDNGRVCIRAGWEAVCRLNIQMRTADRVSLRLGSFPAETFDALFEGVRALPWAHLLPRDARVDVRGKSVRSKLASVPDCQAVTKKALVEAMKKQYGYTWLPETGTRFTVEVNLLKDQASIWIDTTGTGLNKRGYRPIAAEAPIRETLAAALVILSGWRPEMPFADPMCGSGTLPLEAAMIGLRIPPGGRRSFDAEAWEIIGKRAWQEARDEAWDHVRKDAKLDITGSDIDAGVLETARYHARLAGVEQQVVFTRRPIQEFTPSSPGGCLICNPPYGERLEDAAGAREIYRAMGEVARHYPDWGYFVITPEKSFERLFGRPADKRRKLYNGRIECCYYQYFRKTGNSRSRG
ncbi:MAG TPA: RNA methyltransferase [Clostridiales bacterium]|nr:RNA methyltransferase [Clostridiales bacterium]